MSFAIDPPLLFLSGLAIYLLGQKLDWNRHAKIVVGLAVVLTFIAFSALLYADIFRCTFPFFSGMSGSDFMLHTNITGISKADVPSIIVVILFILYPFWTFFGYSSALLLSKRRRVSKEQFTIMYALMTALGLIYSWKHSIEWNMSLLATSIVVGGFMELLGSLGGFWTYHSGEPLMVSIVLSWALNTWAVHGLTYLMGIDLGSHKERYLYYSTEDGIENGDVPWFAKRHHHH